MRRGSWGSAGKVQVKGVVKKNVFPKRLKIKGIHETNKQNRYPLPRGHLCLLETCSDYISLIVLEVTCSLNPCWLNPFSTLEVTVNCNHLKFSPARPRHNHCHIWESRNRLRWPHLPIIEWSCEVDLWRAFENDCSCPWMKALGPGSSRTRAVWITSLEYCSRGPTNKKAICNFNFQFGSYIISTFSFFTSKNDVNQLA